MKIGTSAVMFVLATAAIVALPLSAPIAAASHNPGHYLLWVKDRDLLNYIDSNPHGKLNILGSFYKLLGDGTSSYDWYFYHMQIQSVPGVVAYWECCGSTHRTEYHGDVHKVWSAGTYRWLKDYDPTTTNGYDTETISATVSVSDLPQLSFTHSESYPVPWVKVLDYSDFAEHRAQWNNHFNLWKDTAGSTFKVRPWFVVRTTQDAWSFVDAHYEARFAQHVCLFGCWWEGQSFLGPTVTMDVRRSGDS